MILWKLVGTILHFLFIFTSFTDTSDIGHYLLGVNCLKQLDFSNEFFDLRTLKSLKTKIFQYNTPLVTCTHI